MTISQMHAGPASEHRRYARWLDEAERLDCKERKRDQRGGCLLIILGVLVSWAVLAWLVVQL